MKNTYYIYVVCTILMLYFRQKLLQKQNCKAGQIVTRFDGQSEMRVQKNWLCLLMQLWMVCMERVLSFTILLIRNWRYMNRTLRQKDGSIVKTPDNAFVEVLPRLLPMPGLTMVWKRWLWYTGLELGGHYLFGLFCYHSSELPSRIGYLWVGRELSR